MMILYPSRRRFLEQSGAVLAGLLLTDGFAGTSVYAIKPKISAHLWIYASNHPPNWDATPDLERAFADLQGTGVDGVELMAVNLKHDDAVERIGKLSATYKLPITGTSYSADMWNAAKQEEIITDVTTVIQRLSQLKGKNLGLSVGNRAGGPAKHQKTDAELDAQAGVLRKIVAICKQYQVEPNLHNHTYEVENGLHDLKGTLARLPDIRLGPDLNWMIRAGVNPVDFINTYGQQISYFHIRDQYADGTWTEYVGQGVTDFPAIAAALKAKNFQGNAAIELAFPANYKPQKPLKEVWQLSRASVKKAFGW
ncbi:sugar phosphate isomerase/epimerase family protein [Spirosoma endbachense]|nr:sugar phosphate isomerase/epimerase [Spirosoma endbachense]